MIFQQIQERKINFPNDMNMDAVNLIDMLMQLNPLQRIGYGAGANELDYKALKAHPFFAGLNFDRLDRGLIKPPIPTEMFRNAAEKSEAKNPSNSVVNNIFNEESKRSESLEDPNLLLIKAES